jgi:hypothetical protein
MVMERTTRKIETRERPLKNRESMHFLDFSCPYTTFRRNKTPRRVNKRETTLVASSLATMDVFLPQILTNFMINKGQVEKKGDHKLAKHMQRRKSWEVVCWSHHSNSLNPEPLNPLQESPNNSLDPNPLYPKEQGFYRKITF